MAKKVKDFDVFVNLMDDEIREKVHADFTPCTEADFLKEYQKRHVKKYGDPLQI